MRVLILEDDGLVAAGLHDALMLRYPDWSIDIAQNLAQAKSILAQAPDIELAIVDLTLPDASGTKAPSELKSMRPDLIMIVVTGAFSSEQAAKLIRLGIQDCIPKLGLRPNRLYTAILLAKQRFEREKRIARQAHIDILTGQLNRRGLEAALRQQMLTCEKTGMHTALLTVDVDRFKQLNDMFGHPFGDDILRECARRLASCIRQNDYIGRAGGDEFWLVVGGVPNLRNIPYVANKVMSMFDRPFRLDSQRTDLSISMGAALYQPGSNSPQAWIGRSDEALYRAKRNGRNCWHWIDCPDLDDPGVSPNLLDDHSGVTSEDATRAPRFCDYQK